MTRALLRRTRRARGFTLIELGVVLAVSAILAAAILPDFIESARSKMAEKAAEDVAVIHDAARWFFIQSGNSGMASMRYKWPGETNPNTCANSPGSNPALTELKTAGYLTTFPVNPWNQPYDVELKTPSGASTGGVPFGCSFSVTTNVPTPLKDAFKSFLPQGQCGTANCKAGTAPTGYSRCCAFVPKPGTGLGPCLPPKGLVVDAADQYRLKCQ